MHEKGFKMRCHEHFFVFRPIRKRKSGFFSVGHSLGKGEVAKKWPKVRGGGGLAYLFSKPKVKSFMDSPLLMLTSSPDSPKAF